MQTSVANQETQETQGTQQNYLTVPQFALYWGISTRSVFRLIRDGLPSVKVRGLGRRVLKSQADAFLLAGGFNRKVKSAKKQAKQGATLSAPPVS